jgi:hypothetical protein
MNDRRDRDGPFEEWLPWGGRDPNGRLEAGAECLPSMPDHGGR